MVDIKEKPNTSELYSVRKDERPPVVPGKRNYLKKTDNCFCF